jgi:hypothetical protein
MEKLQKRRRRIKMRAKAAVGREFSMLAVCYNHGGIGEEKKSTVDTKQPRQSNPKSKPTISILILLCILNEFLYVSFCCWFLLELEPVIQNKYLYPVF